MNKLITITRAGYYLAPYTMEIPKQPSYWHNASNYNERAEAKVISPRLAKYQHTKRANYNAPRYHIIHMPTGLVIADVENDLISTVKKTFESSKWTLRGENTLVLVDSSFQWEMTCFIRYTIEDKTMT